MAFPPMLGDDLTIDEKLDLIKRNTAETIGLDEVKQKLSDGLTLHGYWGTAPTRSPSIGYLIPMMKFRDLVNAGVDMRVLIADLHAFLDKGSQWIDKTEQRVVYYIFLIKTILKTLGVADNSYEIVRGMDYQLDKKYILDLLKLLTYVTVNQAKKAGSDVVKQNKEPTLGSLIYPLMQAIDETVLSADIELGGLDQRKIFALSRDNIEKLGYSKCAYVMNEMLPSLGKPGTKMSSSDLNGKIEFLDDGKTIYDKLKKAYCVEKEVKDNPCMELSRLIVYPMKQTIGPFDTYDKLEESWINGQIHGLQLKEWIATAIDKIIDPIRSEILANMALYNDAFDVIT